MGRIATLRAIHKEQKTFSEAEIKKEMAFAHKTMMDAAQKVYADDVWSRRLIEMAVEEYEKILKVRLGLEVI